MALTVSISADMTKKLIGGEKITLTLTNTDAVSIVMNQPCCVDNAYIDAGEELVSYSTLYVYPVTSTIFIVTALDAYGRTIGDSVEVVVGYNPAEYILTGRRLECRS